jgi:flagellar motor protein MotB
MGMVRINYEQMEQLRECSAEMQKPLSRLVAEAVNHWLAVVAPAKLGALRATPPRPVSGKHAQQLLRLIEIGGNVETKKSHRLSVVTAQVRTHCQMANNSSPERMTSGISSDLGD